MLEEIDVGPARRGGQPGAMRGGCQGAPRLVEADVAVHPEAEDQQVHAPGARDAALVPRTLGGGVVRRAVEEVNPPRGEVHVIEEMPLHERAVAARVVSRNPEEFIEVEGGDPREVGAAGRRECHEVVIEPDRRAPRRQPQHQRRLQDEFTRHIARQGARRRGRGSEGSNRQAIHVHRDRSYGTSWRDVRRPCTHRRR